MRTIEARMIQAIRTGLSNSHHDGRILKSGNMEVEQKHHGTGHTFDYYREIEVRLHGNLIAVIEPDMMRIRLSDCGYKTVTTKSRLNALLGAFVPGERIGQVNFCWYTTSGPWQGCDEFAMKIDADNYYIKQAEKLGG